VGITMKSFKEYLTESKKVYAFKIKVAGDLGEDFNSRLKTAMEKFAVEKLSNGKRTPIQETPLDFPTLTNETVTVFDVEINYPTTAAVLENYLSTVCSHPASHIVVRTANEPSEIYQQQMAAKEENGEALLNQEEMEAEDGQELVGERRISDFLKDLTKTKHAGEQYKGVNDELLADKAPAEKGN